MGAGAPGAGSSTRTFWVGAILMVLLFAFVVVASREYFERGHREARKVQCLGQLTQIYGIALSYSSKRGNGWFPLGLGPEPRAHESLNLLVAYDPDALNPRIFCCPEWRGHAAEQDPTTHRYALTEDTCAYAWTRAPLRNTLDSRPLASDKHAGSDAFFRPSGDSGHPGGMNVMFTDGSVQWVETADLPAATRLPEGLTR